MGNNSSLEEETIKIKSESLKIIVDGESKNEPIKWEKYNLTYSCLGKVYASSFEDNYELCKINSHPVLIGYLTAYKDHLPMTITPDIIWERAAIRSERRCSRRITALRAFS